MSVEMAWGCCSNRTYTGSALHQLVTFPGVPVAHLRTCKCCLIPLHLDLAHYSLEKLFKVIEKAMKYQESQARAEGGIF